MKKFLDTYGPLKTSITFTLFVIFVASIFTYLFLYFYQGFVDAPGYLLPLALPIVLIFYPSFLFFGMYVRTENAENRLREKNKELKKAMDEIVELSGLLPICSSCKNIRDDKGYWNQIESYLSEKSGIEFSHSICPDCAKKLYPKYAKSRLDKQAKL